MLIRQAVLLLTLFISTLVVIAFPTDQFIPGPKKGDFGYPPAGYEDKEPGTILKSQKVQPYQLGIAKIGVTGYKVLYRSSARSSSEPMAATMIIIVPNNPDTGKVVIHAPPEDSASTECAPSIVFKKSDKFSTSNLFARGDLLMINIYLKKGMTVIIPDYEGPNAAFSAGPISGHAILDATRAAKNLRGVNLKNDVKFVALGYSGGAFALGWAAQLHGTYAPDANIVGYAIGGTPTNVTDHIVYNDERGNGAFFINSMAGIINGNPDAQKQAPNYFNRKGLAALHWTRSHCPAFKHNIKHIHLKHTSNWFLKGDKKFAEIPLLVDLAEKNTLGHEDKPAPIAPVFMYHLKSDEIVPYKASRDTAKSWCEKDGSNVEFQTQTCDLPHMASMFATFAHTMRFMYARFEGKEFHGGSCHFSTVSCPTFDMKDTETVGHSLDHLKTLFDEAFHKY